MQRRLRTVSVLALSIALILVFMARPLVAQSPCGDFVIVESGETLFSIAQRCNTTVAALLRANPQIADPDRIFVGQVVRMPGAAPPPTPIPSPTPSPTPIPGDQYQVQPGETLVDVAQQFNVALISLVRANAALLQAGQILSIPTSGPFSPAMGISPTEGSPGTSVRVLGCDFPPSSRVRIVTRQGDTQLDVLFVNTGVNGCFSGTITIPGYAPLNQRVTIAAETTVAPILQRTTTFLVSSAVGGEPGDQTQVQLYLISPGTGELGCGDEVVPVTINIPADADPVTRAYQRLLGINEREYGQSGLYNPLHRSDLSVESTTISARQATVRLTGDFQIGGVCDGPRVEAILRRTALQFDNIDDVTIYINDQPLERMTRLSRQ